MSLSRRLVLAQIGAGALAAAAHGQALGLAPTPKQTEGPFYPSNPIIESDADLTRIAGRTQRALGQVIEVKVRILDRSGKPLRGARAELWQANAAGKYDHPNDNNAAPVDPNFQGFARLAADDGGMMDIVTVKPGSYPSGRRMRTPHLHWRISTSGADLTTQMYFPGEPLNERDQVLDRLADPRSVIARSGYADEPGAQAFLWDVVLAV
jgi:protocatechuate 3,4-dioxygenase beta subunit